MFKSPLCKQEATSYMSWSVCESLLQLSLLSCVYVVLVLKKLYPKPRLFFYTSGRAFSLLFCFALVFWHDSLLLVLSASVINCFNPSSTAITTITTVTAVRPVTMFMLGRPGVVTLDRPASNFDVAGEWMLQRYSHIRIDQSGARSVQSHQS